MADDRILLNTQLRLFDDVVFVGVVLDYHVKKRALDRICTRLSFFLWCFGHSL